MTTSAKLHQYLAYCLKLNINKTKPYKEWFNGNLRLIGFKPWSLNKLLQILYDAFLGNKLLQIFILEMATNILYIIETRTASHDVKEGHRSKIKTNPSLPKKKKKTNPNSPKGKDSISQLFNDRANFS